MQKLAGKSRPIYCSIKIYQKYSTFEKHLAIFPVGNTGKKLLYLLRLICMWFTLKLSSRQLFSLFFSSMCNVAVLQGICRLGLQLVFLYIFVIPRLPIRVLRTSWRCWVTFTNLIPDQCSSSLWPFSFGRTKLGVLVCKWNYLVD
jgi:hypothetical protein